MGITGKIYGINGPVITIQGNLGYKMNEMVYVGEKHLVGEVIRLTKEKTTIQVYEETSGLKPGEKVIGAGSAISVKLAPGILNNIFDGIERPLQKIAEKSGAFIPTGAQAAYCCEIFLQISLCPKTTHIISSRFPVRVSFSPQTIHRSERSLTE